MNTKINKQDDVKTYWEQVALSRWGTYTTEIEKQAILEAIELAGRPSVALEVGCEGGRWSQLLIELGWDMICTDVNRNSLDICQKRIPTAKCILVNPDEARLSFEEKSLSLLLCVEVFEVIHSDWFIREAFRILKHDGVLVGVVHNKFSLRAIEHRIKRLINRKKGIYGHYSYKHKYSKWKKELLYSGFNVLYEKGFCWLPFSRSSNFFLIPQLTKIEHFLGLRNLINLSPWIVFIARKV